ncbi:disease resistance protein Roq1-like isoform X2 [Lotus japonicus]|nr:disease resistance protein Roq1-like isoform X2 [Lotus japonicus]
MDDKLKRGQEIWPSLVGAIEGSLVSVIIFSENYATSRWCLNELVKILECRDKYVHTVIPVFYCVDPTDVRHQTGSYKAAFAEHTKEIDPTMVQTWRDALNKSANLSGNISSDFRNDAELLGKIINDVLHQVRRLSKPTLNSKGFVGIGKSIADIEVLLLKQSKDVCIIGIWGMGGIGKTTIAEQVFNKICFEYEGTCFLSNVREELERHGTIYLKEKLFSTLLGEDVKITSPSGLSYYIWRRISRMKVLIVLDDVNDSDQLELFGTVDNFGSGSRIIVTTRDKQLLIAKEVDDIHEVGVLSSGEALELFNLIALNQSHLEMEYHETSKRIVDYAKGIPLVLKVLGHLLRGKDQKVWESHLDKLKEMPSKKVYDVMKLSYDDLDRKEKTVFRDISCFFNGMNMKVDSIKALLKDRESDNSVAHALERLKDKALIIVSKDNVVSVHDIIKEMAWEIVRQESDGNIGNQSRFGDVDEVLENDKGTDAIRIMRMNLSKIKSSNLKFSSNMFSRMRKLQFLDFYGEREDYPDILPEGLQSLPNKLRYLRWMNYPLKSLPEKFSAEKLVMLDMTYSNVEILWDGVQNLVNLKQVKLRCCVFLKELPDFSKATNLEVLIASFCYDLTCVHPFIFSLGKLEKLDLSHCSSLTSLTSNAQPSCLSYLNLEGCKDLTEFSVTSENMIELNLSDTGIKALPSSFGSQRKLEILDLEQGRIESLPSCIVNLTRLRYLNLSDCEKLQTLPELPPSVETLLTRGCSSLKTVLFPSTATEQSQENKKRVEFFQCESLDERSLWKK